MRIPSYAVLAPLLFSAAPVFGQTCQLPSIADTAKLVPVAGSNLMAVPVAINGKAKQFLLDLGVHRQCIANLLSDLLLGVRARLLKALQQLGYFLMISFQ